MLWAAFLAGGMARLIFVPVIRFFYHRPRPFLVLQEVHQLLRDSAYSFPSGHASFFFAAAIVLFAYDKRWGVSFFVLGVLVSAARVAAGVHYPSDIFGGLIVGVVAAWLFLLFKKRIAGVI